MLTQALPRLSRHALIASMTLLSGALAGSCVAPADGLAMRVEWGLTDPAATLPTDVTLLRILVYVDGSETPEENFAMVATLDDDDGNGRPEFDRSGIPPGVPIRMTIEGQDAGGRTLYVGHAGPFVLQHGERRYVDLRMYAINDGNVIDATPLTPRFLHTATTLPDGRVLFAGGFDRLAPTTCPAGTADPMAECYAATGATSAALFDPASGRTRATRTPMLAARGGHTATLLPDGRVLLAGGAETATLVFENQAGGFSFRMVPGAGGRSFELFDYRLNAEEEDVDRDGDPARGGFVGAADDVMMPGRLDDTRVMHAAALLSGGRVLLAGGVGSPSTFTVFDPQRAGGYGVVGNGALGPDRLAPGAIGVGEGIAARGWIFGGADASANADLADVWRSASAADVLGSTMPASTSGFPDASSTPRPEFALFRPIVAPIMAGTHAVVVGWYGPRCTGATPAFAPGSPYCGYLATNLRSFTVNLMTGVATPTMVRNAHAFGASAVLADGRVAITGGINGLNFQPGNTIELFTGQVMGGAAALSPALPLLRAGRAMHTTVALDDGGLATFGGIAPSADLASITLVTGLEVHYLR